MCLTAPEFFQARSLKLLDFACVSETSLHAVSAKHFDPIKLRGGSFKCYGDCFGSNWGGVEDVPFRSILTHLCEVVVKRVILASVCAVKALGPFSPEPDPLGRCGRGLLHPEAPFFCLQRYSRGADVHPLCDSLPDEAVPRVRVAGGRLVRGRGLGVRAGRAWGVLASHQWLCCAVPHQPGAVATEPRGECPDADRGVQKLRVAPDGVNVFSIPFFFLSQSKTQLGESESHP